jgi:serine/threonine-protein kinase
VTGLANPIIGSRYELLHPLGGGASADVYLARDLVQGDVVAVKAINPATLAGRPWNAEAQILTGLRGERILPIRNAEVYAGQPIIVTDVAVNGTIANQLPPHGLSASASLRWIRQACAGLQRIHDAGLLHCDIKPENLFLDELMNVMVGDLGLATIKPPGGPSHNFNSPTSVAPEVAAARLIERTTGTLQPGRNSVASDVYSLGATLYLLVSGRWPHPWQPSTIEDRLLAVSTTPPVPLEVAAPHLRRDLRLRIEKAIAAQPSDRYQSPGQMAAALGEPATRQRVWVRTDEHVSAGHLQCFRGACQGRADATVCVMSAAAPGPSSSRRTVAKVDIETRRGANRLKRGCFQNVRDTPALRAQRLRAAFRAAE